MDEREWLRGAQLWYNYQDYLGAIDVWQDAIEASMDWNDDQASLSDDSHFDLLAEASPDSPNAARLLLFLAGCQLDAQDVKLARRTLIRCLRCCLNDGFVTSTTARLAIQEWLCSYEEEAHVNNDGQEALAMSRRIVEFAIREGCTYWKDPMQRPGFMSPLLPRGGQSHYSGADRPSWCGVLEENWEKIKEEFFQLTRPSSASPTDHWPAVGTSDHRGGAGQHDHKVVDGDWREVVLIGSGARPDLAPFTSRLIQSYVPEAVTLAEDGGGEVIFSVLSPKTRIRPHCGSTDLRLTAHLGLSIPSISEEECAIRVGNKWHTWEEGKVLVFDDSYEHEVKNMTSTYRAVLLIRFWHPNLLANDRSRALAQAVEAKEQDSLRRYNPPLPASLFNEVEGRGLEQTRCPSCWRTGYDTIRVVEIDNPRFVCTCGQRIVKS